MSGFEENVAVMGEWVPCNPSSKRVLERELSLNHGQVTSNNNKDSSQTNNISGGGLRERIAARAGFNTPRLNTENIRSNTDSSSLRSPCLTISSPGLSPATLLDSPVFLSNPLVSSKSFPYLDVIMKHFMNSNVTFVGSTVSNYREIFISSGCSQQWIVFS